ncbi:hypothetical protein ANCDUO_19300 [Ancylostoma duodenale]|uniref:Uncharacterized protein n=1 Tax=Ancylostoma duodenale TaxID=51022 RepID=A0A0C2FVA7_9BILA|nr:hypothetical protein ANCDUO_19300 [Ancylostoma duodenale]
MGKQKIAKDARNALTIGRKTNGPSLVRSFALFLPEEKFDGQYCRVELEIPDALVGHRLRYEALNEIGNFYEYVRATLALWVALQISATFLSPESWIWMCLNIKNNTRKALSTKRAPESLHALHGLEFITFIWFITAMVYNLMQPYIENVAFSYDSVSLVAAHPTNNYSYLIDGLLALSALYTTYLLYGEVSTVKDILQVLAKTLVR